MIITPEGKFRRMPRNKVLDEPSQQEWCDMRTGHVLYVTEEDQIKCRNCGATWRDEGF